MTTEAAEMKQEDVHTLTGESEHPCCTFISGGVNNPSPAGGASTGTGRRLPSRTNASVVTLIHKEETVNNNILPVTADRDREDISSVSLQVLSGTPKKTIIDISELQRNQ